MKTVSDPIRDRAHDGIYPRCVWCNGENYAPNVIVYSKGLSACHQCGKLLPEEYVLDEINSAVNPPKTERTDDED